MLSLTWPPAPPGGSPTAGTNTFSFTGAPQFFTVPPGVTSIGVDAFGSKGADYAGVGGLGGRTYAVLNVVPGETLTVDVGGQAGIPAGGWNGGAPGQNGFSAAGGGGGASDIRQAGGTRAARAVVAGGGGGAVQDGWGVTASGGGGGGGDGLPGTSPNQWGGGGGGGTLTSGGAGGAATYPGNSGRFGTGGVPGCCGNQTGGGGGGGYYGGGGGSSHSDNRGGGGGGSGYAGAGASGVISEAAVNNGDGVVVITYPASSAAPPLSARAVMGRNPAMRHANEARGCAGDPCDTGSGNYHETFEDLAIAGRGPGIAFTRSYNSMLADVDGPLGFGWTHSYAISLATDPDGVVTIRQEEGAEVSFTPDGGVYTAPPRVTATLVHNGDGTWTFVRQKHEVLTFDTTGKLSSIKDLNNYASTLTYNGTGQLTKVTDAAGRFVTLTYSGTHLTSVKDALVTPVRKVSFGYDASGNLKTVTDVGLGVWRFTYDASHHLVTKRTPRNAAANKVVTNHYDATGRVDLQTDELGRQTTFDYTSIANATKITDPAGHVRLDEYADGLRLATTEGYGTAQAATWRFAYDPVTLGMTSVIDPNGHAVSMTYDASGNLLTGADALGRTTTYTYNALDEPLSMTDAKGVTTIMTYDGAGNPLTSSTPLVGSEPAQSRVTTLTYADPGHPGDVTSLTDALGKLWFSTYDAAGNRTAATDPLGHTRTWAYNPDGWPTSTVAPRGNVVGADPAAFRTSFAYDAYGHVVSTTDPLGHMATRHFDLDGNLDQATDAENRVTGFVYDAAGQLITVARPDATTMRNDYWGDGALKTQYDGANAATGYAYDPQGRLASVTDPLNRTTTYGYDPAGNRVTVTDPSGRVTTSSYDLADQLIALDYSDPSTSDVTSITYDADGQRTGRTEGTGTLSWTWDSLHRLTTATNGAGSPVAYGYDLEGRVTSITYPGNRTVTRAYDDAGRWTGVTDWLGKTTSFGYDDNDNLGITTFPATTTNVDTSGFDNADRMTATTMKKGVATLASLTYGRDNSDLLTSSTPTGLPQGTETYGYSALSQLATVNGSGQFANDEADNLTTLNGVAGLAYDAANQLGSVPHGGAPTTFAYDTQGNRTGMTVPAGRSFTYGYDQANRLSTVATTNAVGLTDAGSAHNLAVKSDGTLWSWGLNTNGQLGLGDTTVRATATQVPSLAGVTQVSTGANHSLAVKSDGTVWSWGLNTNSQLGDGTTSQRTTPVQVYDLHAPVAVAAGATHNLALAADGSVWAWGRNANGQLGDGTITRRSKPVRVPGLSGVVAIAAGSNHSLAVKADGTVWAWGINTYGQLGDGTVTQQLSPVQVASLGDAVSVAAGGNHSLALKADGTVWGWGYNGYSQLGDNTTTQRNTPVQASGLTGATSIQAGLNHSLARKADGTAWLWGRNTNGQLGDGTTAVRRTPVAVAAFDGAGLAGGDSYTLAVRADGTGRAAGLNTSNQLGDGTTTNSTVPVTVSGLSGIAPGTLATYSFDADGLRSSKTVLGATTQFTWDSTGGLPLLLLDGDTAYVYGPGGVPVEQVSASGAAIYFHHDQLGSTRLLSDETGNAVGTLAYDAYGTLAASTGTVTTPFGYAGQYTDGETGFQYLRARYYDPATGQFLTRDPIVALTGEAYGYVGGSPLNGTDPTGLWDHVATKYLDWSFDDFTDLDCDELFDLMNALIKELRNRDKDFQRNKKGYDYGDKGYTNHVWFYQRVQTMLIDVQSAYEFNDCDDLGSENYQKLNYWETKPNAPLGHPGQKPAKSLWGKIGDAAKFLPIPVPVPAL